jgi:uncharacterized protein YbjT (DUF2867 family)
MANMERLVTLFGGGGFLGRYVVQELLAAGVRVRIAERNPGNAWSLRTQGGLGQIQFVAADILRPESAGKAAAGSDAVINLVGILKGDFNRIHVAGAANAASAAAAAGASAFVQISAIGADAAAVSAYARSKGEGEAAVRAAFPAATIIRPSILFGPEDQFVNRFARLAQLSPAIPVIKSDARFQPAWVVDVARAVAQAALHPELHGGNIYELGGPQTISMAELNHWIGEAIGARRTFLPIPDAVAAAMARFGGWLPGAPITWDQWLMLQKDNVVAPDARGFAAFGIEPTPLAAVAPEWLVQYRRHGRFAYTRNAA